MAAPSRDGGHGGKHSAPLSETDVSEGSPKLRHRSFLVLFFKKELLSFVNRALADRLAPRRTVPVASR
jgi:hypothetical protein